MKPKFIEYLNDILSDSMSEEQAIDRYEYLGKPSTIRNAHANRLLGDLIRRKDPTAYNVAKNEYQRGR